MDLLLPKCDQRLRNLLDGIRLQQLSRVPATRLQQTAVPNIGIIELVCAEAFEQSYQPLYLSMFHGAERERADLIVRRLHDDFAGRRQGLAPYRIVGLRDSDGEAIGAAQFSVLRLRTSSDDVASPEFAVPYVQYIYVRAQNRRQDLSEVLHTFVLAIASADARAKGEARARRVPFTLFETEPPGHGEVEASRANATERTAIHARSGARAMMLRSKTTPGRCISAHVQPGLEPGDGPLTLCWATRPSPLECDYDCNAVGKASIAAYYQSLRDEGFPEGNIALAERMVARRCRDAEFCEMPLSHVTAAMYQGLQGEVADHRAS